MHQEIYLDYAIRLLEAARRKYKQKRKSRATNLFETVSEEGITDKIKDFFKNIWEKIKRLFSLIKEKMKKVWNSIIGKESENAKEKEILKDIQTNMGNIINSAETSTKTVAKKEIQNANEKTPDVEELIQQLETADKSRKQVVGILRAVYYEILNMNPNCKKDKKCWNTLKLINEALHLTVNLKLNNKTYLGKNIYESLFNKIRSGLSKTWEYVKAFSKVLLISILFTFLFWILYELMVYLLERFNISVPFVPPESRSRIDKLHKDFGNFFEVALEHLNEAFSSRILGMLIGASVFIFIKFVYIINNENIDDIISF